MGVNIQRTLGFFLLAAGIGLILYTLFASYLIFTGSSEAPEFFLALQERSADPSPSIGSFKDLQNQIPDLLGQQLKGLLPADTIPRMLNLAVWSMLAGLLLFGGSLIAGIGVRLVK